MKVALIIGHNSIKKGAYSKYLNQNEYDYYCDVADHLQNDFIDVYYRKDVGSYTQEMRKVVNSINLNNYDFAIELHFNSASDAKVNGAEVLAHKNSIKGQKLAKEFLNKLCSRYDLKNRGIVNITESNQRGGYGICMTNCPYILIEPFFGSNKEALKFDKKEFANFLNEFIKEVIL